VRIVIFVARKVISNELLVRLRDPGDVAEVVA
jgi:hypothetical protein